MNIVIPKPVNEILNLLYENNYDGFLVGRTIRLMVMDEKPDEYIICTNASIESLSKIFKAYDTTISGVENKILIINNNKFPMRIFNYGTKENTLESYLTSQDFTMNALAYSDEEGLIDYNTGVLDIKNGIIKINGNDDENIIADPLRILKAIRLSAEYKTHIDLQTVEYMFDNKELLNEVAKERVRDEFCKILQVKGCAFYLKKYLDIFLVIIPELTLMENFEQNDPYHICDVLEHTLVALKNSENSLNVRLAVLFHDIAKPLTYVEDKKGIGRFPNHCQKGAEITREIMNRLKFDKKTIQLITKVIGNHNVEIPIKDSKLKEFLSKFSKEELELLFKVRQADALAKNPAFMSEVNKVSEDFNRVKKVIQEKSCLKRNELQINGKDLLEIGISQNEIGKSLDKIFSAVLSNKIKNDKISLMTYAETHFK